MVVGVCRLKLYLPGNGSLKQKRARLRPLLNRLHKEFNLSAAEVDLQDVWQSALIGLAVVSNEPGHAHTVLEHAVHWIEVYYPDVEVVDWNIEIV